jgi:hypothetical protein
VNKSKKNRQWAMNNEQWPGVESQKEGVKRKELTDNKVSDLKTDEYSILKIIAKSLQYSKIVIIFTD